MVDDERPASDAGAPPGVGDYPPAAGRDRRAEALSMWHLMTRSPKSEYCDTCKAVKLQRRPARRVTNSHDGDDDCEKLGDVMSIDHITPSVASALGFTGERYAIFSLIVRRDGYLALR